ncbi:TetR/AcrR family transcriptional regulator [Microbacterium sp. cx-55]|uniref:TetR/AcrR family transcriptional regulator n=1 Tax=Microbacterium sp. cx-55 TaxID=2875948 RepID=UPI001CBDB19C|nr:TetR/AcrR family transcriptional regulator [Microbacterium sp. cx-55]MBZ4487386.1 TetR/AcrR family transcriptional regulator [Microbacterium sp. cx-55]
MPTAESSADTPERRRLAGLVADLILADGMLDHSLSGIARQIGSNNRMLLYYFGSKGGLLQAAAARASERFPHLAAVFDRLGADDLPLEARLLRAWDDIGDEANRPYLVMFFHRFGVAIGAPDEWAEFLGELGTGWVALVRDVLVAEGYPQTAAENAATRIVAQWRGLQFALLCGMPAAVLSDAYRVGIRELLAGLPPRAHASD